MSRVRDRGLWSLALASAIACAYPHLEMGGGVAGSPSIQQGGASTRSSMAASGASTTRPREPAAGGTSARESTPPGTSTPASGGTLVAPTGGGGLAPSGGVTSSETTASAPAGGVTGTSETVVVQGGTTATTSSATSTSIGRSCLSSTDLLDYLDAGDEGGQWIGGAASDPSDDPCGVQGRVYAFGDAGSDGEECTDDDTIQSPACYGNSGAKYSPCANGRCCIGGSTSSAPDAWGAGIGLFLNMDASGDPSPYAGQVKGFVLHTSGNLNGQALTFFYIQDENEENSPSLGVPSLGDIPVAFSAVSCNGDASCSEPTQHPTMLQLFVNGGADGDFELCIDGITPIL